MQLLVDVAGDGFEPSLWDLLRPVLGWACLSGRNRSRAEGYKRTEACSCR